MEDLGDFSDFYIMPETGMDNWQKAKLQEIQDEVQTNFKRNFRYL